jgi:hypothetical protein
MDTSMLVMTAKSHLVLPLQHIVATARLFNCWDSDESFEYSGVTTPSSHVRCNGLDRFAGFGLPSSTGLIAKRTCPFVCSSSRLVLVVGKESKLPLVWLLTKMYRRFLGVFRQLMRVIMCLQFKQRFR